MEKDFINIAVQQADIIDKLDELSRSLLDRLANYTTVDREERILSEALGEIGGGKQ